LKVLQQQGQVRELNLNGEIGRFEADCGNHYHFRCESCGRVFDIDEPVHDELERHIAERTGLKITSHQLEFRGLCIACQRKTENQPEND
jgi:Fur family ferric uptake transcriptional regulator/Fur family peroxide stress response transcriptional regulator